MTKKKGPPTEDVPLASTEKKRNVATSMTKAQFALVFGVSESQLERLFQQGMPSTKTGRRVEIPMPDGRVFYHEYLVKKGRKQAEPSSIDEARKRAEIARASLAELELAERQGELMTVEEATTWFGDACGRVDAKLKNLAPRLAGVVLGSASIQEAQARIDPLVEEIRAELRAADDVPNDDASSDEDERGSA